MRKSRRGLLAVPCALALVLAACGGDDGTEETTEVESEVEAEREPERTTDTTPDEPEVEIDSMDLDVVVEYGFFEYDFIDLEVDDENAESSGIELTFNTSVENLTDDSATPNPTLNLVWDEGSDVVMVDAGGDFREIPGGSSSSAEITTMVTPDDMETWDMDSARLVIGSDGSAQAQVPLGDDAELITRLPVEQDIDEEIVLGDLTMEVVESQVRWDYSANQQVDEGTALLVITVDIVNDTDSQNCFDSGDFSLTLPDGNSRTLDEITERCHSGGESTSDVSLLFELDEPYDGEYELEIEGGRATDDAVYSFSFELEEGEGARSDDDEDEDDDDDDDDEDEDEEDDDDEDDDDEDEDDD